MKTRRRSKRAVHVEQLEQRWVLSASAATTVDNLLAQAPQLVDAKTMTSLVASALADAPQGDPIYMRYGAIKGDITAPGFEGDIQLNSFQWGIGRGISNATPAGGREISSPSVSEISVTKQFDQSSVPLIQEAFGGTPQDVEIDFVKTLDDKPQIYLKMDLSNTLLSGYSMNSGGDRPSESLSLNFTRIQVESIDDKGAKQDFAFDLAKEGTTFLPATASASNAPALNAATQNSATSALTSADAGDPIYMKYGDIAGDVTTPGYRGEIQLNSFQWGVGRAISSPVAGAQRQVSAPNVSEATVTKNLDSSSIPLIEQAFGGAPTHVITNFVNLDAKVQTYFKVTLDNTLVSGYSMSSGGDRPAESLSLNFTKITFTSTSDNGTNQVFTYNLAKVAIPAAAASVAAPTSVTAPTLSATADVGSDPIYMRYGDITGDVTQKGYVGDIDIHSVQWGVGRTISSPTAAGGRQISAPSVSEVVVSKTFDSSSIPLIQQAFVGTPTDAELDFVNPATTNHKASTYLKLMLGQTLVSGYSMSSGGDTPSESLSLNFTKIRIIGVDASGAKQTFKYNIARNVNLKTAAQTASSTSPASVPTAASSSASDDPIYMRYGEIKGDVTTTGFEGASQLNSFQWGIGRAIGSPTDRGGDREISPPTVSEVVVSKLFDSSSVPLIQEAFQGAPAHVEFDFANLAAKLETYLKVQLDDNLISGYSMSSRGDRPSESLSLNFTKITFTAQNADGKQQTFSFDLAKERSVIAAATASVAASSTPQSPLASAASDTAGGDPIYMKYGDIKGDVTVDGYAGSTELDSFQWGVSRQIGAPDAAGRRQVSLPSVSEAEITKSFDSSSVPLIQEAIGGLPAHVETDFVNTVKDKGQTYFSVDLDNTLISRYSMGSGGDRPTESLSLNFTRISFINTTDSGQQQKFTFDLVKPAVGIAAAGVASPVLAPSQPLASTVSVSNAVLDDPIYMKYGDIKGEVTTDGYAGAIQVNSFQWGVSRTIGSAGADGQRFVSAPIFQDVVVTRNFDSTSVPLLQQSVGTDPNDVRFTFANVDEKGELLPYLVIDLGNTLISSYAIGSGGDRPSESLSLNYTRFTISTFNNDQTQNSGTWDLTKVALT